MDPINKSWTDANGNPTGGISTGIGFTIAWQHGPLTDGRNGAFLIEVLESCAQRLSEYQATKFACAENSQALVHLANAIGALKQRAERRQQSGTLGTHILDDNDRNN